MDADRLLLRPKEAAKSLGLAPSTLYQLLTSGEIESIRVGGCRRIPLDALTAYIERLRREQGA